MKIYTSRKKHGKIHVLVPVQTSIDTAPCQYTLGTQKLVPLSLDLLKSTSFRGGFAPLDPLPGLCSGPTGGLKRPPDLSQKFCVYFILSNYAPDWYKGVCGVHFFSCSLNVVSVKSVFCYPSREGHKINHKGFC